MKKKRIVFRLIAIALLVGTFVFSLFPTVASASNDYDYSRPGSVGTLTYSAADFISEYLGSAVADAEREYLNIYSDFSFSYASNIPTSYVTVEFDKGQGVLAVKADKYSYVAENGSEVVWTPCSVTYNENETALTFEDDKYHAEIQNVDAEGDSFVNISYSATFNITAESINEFLNLAYFDAAQYKTDFEKKESEYEAAKAEYEADKTLYDEYLAKLSEYQMNIILYNEYVNAARIYAENKEKYDTYQRELAEFNEAWVLYLEYDQKLQQYKKDLAEFEEYRLNLPIFEEQKKAYEQYLINLKRIDEHFALMDMLKKPSTSLNRTIYSAIMGDTVTEVVANKDLVSGNLVGADPDAVDLAGVSTEALRILLTDYFKRTTERGKYEYYVDHYEEIRDNIVNLFVSLDELYSTRGVWTAVKERGMQEKFQILMAQLYYAAHAFSDTPINDYDGNPITADYYADKMLNEKPLQIIGTPLIEDSDNAAPVSGGYPQEMQEPVLVPVEQPTVPEYVKKPTPIDPVEDPGQPPLEVQKPEEPAFVEEPVEPKPYDIPENVKKIIELFDTGVLQRREALTEDVEIVAVAAVNKKYYGAEDVDVVYHDIDGNQIYKITVDRGTFADFGAEVPKKAEDESATYVFAGWRDADGFEPDLHAVTKDLYLYPKFTTVYKEYEVKWNIGDNTFSERLLWGELPECPLTPEKESTESEYYVFTGWDKKIVPVSGNAEYTAKFEKKYFIPFQSTGGAEITLNDGTYTVDCRKGFSNEFVIESVVERAAGTASVKIQTMSGDISFSYSDTQKMQSLGVNKFNLTHEVKGNDGNIYSLSLYDDSGDLISEPLSASVTLSCSASDFSRLNLYKVENGERTEVRYSENGKGDITFSAVNGAEYHALTEYSVTLLDSEIVTLNANKILASPGEKITVTVDVPNGVTFNRLYTVNKLGEKETMEEDSFIMPAADVRIGAEASYNTYIIKFVSNGKIIAEYSCRYGDKVIVPEDPKRVPDSDYEYTFIGWSKKITDVTEDALYTAEYSKTPIVKNDQSGLQISPSVMKILLLAGSAVLITLCGIIPSSIMIPVLIFKRKKQIQNNKKRCTGAHMTKKR